MPFVPLVEMGALVYCLVNFFKNLKAGLWSPVATQIFSWAAGVLVVFLYASTDWADKMKFGDATLATLNGSSLVAIGLSAASLFGVAAQTIKAVDGNDTAKIPPMIPEEAGA